MHHREYLKQINEAPIAYDDGTSSLIGKTDKVSKTKWTEAPQVKATIEEIIEWVIEAQKKGFVNKEILGQGVSRMCKMNDGKTVFKFNYDPVENQFGNQSAYENKFFKKWGSKYGDILSHIYKSGDNWQIVEAIKKFEIGTFEDLTKVNWKDFRRIARFVFVKQLKADYKKAGSIEGAFELMKEENPHRYENSQGQNILDQILKSKDLVRIFQCACETGLSIRDLHDGNLGFRGKNLVIIDYGFDEKR